MRSIGLRLLCCNHCARNQSRKMNRSLSSMFTLLFMGIALLSLTVTCAPAETRTTYPKTFFRSKSTSSYSEKSTDDYKPVPTVTYQPTARSVINYKPTTVAPAYKATTMVPATTYKPAIAPEAKYSIVAPYVKNTFFKSKSPVNSDKSTTSYRPAMEEPMAAVKKYNPSVNPSAEINYVPAEKVKGESYVNTFFKNKPKASASNYNKVTTGATTSQPQPAVISPVKISEPVNEGNEKTVKKVPYTNTYFKAKTAIVSSQVPTLDKSVAKLNTNDSSSEESSEEAHGLDDTSESGEESSEEDGEGTSEEEEGEDIEEASHEAEENEEKNEKEKGKKEDKKDEESKDKTDVKSDQKPTVIWSPPTPTVKSIHIVDEKKNAKPVFLAFKKMRTKHSNA